MTDAQRLAEIEQRANAATTGPWSIEDLGESDGAQVMANRRCISDDCGVIEDPRDQEFIAHAREDIPYLLARVRALEAGPLPHELQITPEGNRVCRWCGEYTYDWTPWCEARAR